MHSIDIFGTIVEDTEANKKAFFNFVQNELRKDVYRQMPCFIQTNFAQLRYNAELMAYKISKKEGKEQPNLSDIYKIISKTTLIEKGMLERLEQLENELFVETVVGIEKNVCLAEELILNGEKVIFLADCVYNKVTIKLILQKCSQHFENCQCFCSSEYGKTQRTGALFWRVNQITQIRRCDWMYYSTSDEKLKQAGNIGIATRKLIGTDSIFDIKQYGVKADLTFQLMNHVSQSALNDCRERNQRVGVCIGAPILLAYVEWILNNAIELKLEKLYFVARDGYILKKISDKLIDQRKYNIETHYIYGSRKAWRMPSLSKKNCNIAELLRWSHVERVKTYGDLADIFELTVDELEMFLTVYGINTKTCISRAALAYCIEQLKNNDDFKDYLIAKNSFRKRLLADYLHQELGEEDKKVAFVELAGGGYTQECLANVLNDLGIVEIINFYFKMDSIRSSDKCINYVFWLNDMKNSAIIETMCHSSEGQTMGYAMQEEKIVPVLEEEENQLLKDFKYDSYVDGVLKFVNIYIKYLNGFLQRNNVSEMISAYMEIIGKYPGKDLLMFIGTMPFGVTGRERCVLEYAPVLTRKQIRNYYLFGIKEGVSYSGMCWEYSVMRTSSIYPKEMRFYRKVGEIVNANKLFPKFFKEKSSPVSFPMELVAPQAVFISLDETGDRAYAMIQRDRKEIDKVSVAKITSLLPLQGKQVIIGTADNKLMNDFKEKLLEYGVELNQILAIDLTPRYVIGK